MVSIHVSVSLFIYAEDLALNIHKKYVRMSKTTNIPLRIMCILPVQSYKWLLGVSTFNTKVQNNSENMIKLETKRNEFFNRYTDG